MSTTEHDTTAVADEVQAELVEDDVDTAAEDQDDEVQEAEVVAEAPKRKRAKKAELEVAEAKPVEEKSAFTPARARALTEKLVKNATTAVELFIEAYNGRIWLAYGYESWQQYLDAELGELRPRLPKPQRLEITSRMKVEAKMSQGAIAAALGVDQKTVSNDLRELRGAEADSASEVSVGVDGVERAAGDRSARRKPYIERVSAVFDKLDKAFGDLTEIAAEEEWEQELGAIANRHRPDVSRFIGQLQGLKDTFNSAPDFEG